MPVPYLQLGCNPVIVSALSYTSRGGSGALGAAECPPGWEPPKTNGPSGDRCPAEGPGSSYAPGQRRRRLPAFRSRLGSPDRPPPGAIGNRRSRLTVPPMLSQCQAPPRQRHPSPVNESTSSASALFTAGAEGDRGNHCLVRLRLECARRPAGPARGRGLPEGAVATIQVDCCGRPG